MTWDYAAEPKEAVTSCNLCGGQKFEEYGKRDRYGLPVKSVRCKDCGLVFINPHMTADGYRRFYADGHYRTLLSKFYGRPIMASTMAEAQGNYAEAIAMMLERFLAKRQCLTLFDVGGSTGIVAETFRRRFGFIGTVLEPSKNERTIAERKGLKTIDSMIESFEPNGHRWDLVLMCQTVDHLIDITAALKNLRRAVSSRGLFYMDILDSDKFSNRSSEKFIKVDHPYYLSGKIARRYLDQAGFRIVATAKGPLSYQSGFLCAPKAST
jgi:hypothetical protein